MRINSRTEIEGVIEFLLLNSTLQYFPLVHCNFLAPNQNPELLGQNCQKLNF